MAGLLGFNEPLSRPHNPSRRTCFKSSPALANHGEKPFASRMERCLWASAAHHTRRIASRTAVRPRAPLYWLCQLGPYGARLGSTASPSIRPWNSLESSIVILTSLVHSETSVRSTCYRTLSRVPHNKSRLSADGPSHPQRSRRSCLWRASMQTAGRPGAHNV